MSEEASHGDEGNTSSPWDKITGFRVMCKNPPLRWVGHPDYPVVVQGVFRMQDEVGFPIDASFDLCGERGHEIDWVEALADAGRQNVDKMLKVRDNMVLLIGHEKAAIVYKAFVLLFTYMPEFKQRKSFCEVAQAMYEMIWKETKD